MKLKKKGGSTSQVIGKPYGMHAAEWGNLGPEQMEIVAALNDLTDVAIQRKEKDREINSRCFQFVIPYNSGGHDFWHRV
ncbi:hypothetical protein [Paenibacillus sp. Root444D2]|uniref:hypothetical protein n=1 Tax=Paenibacillus sp. Root444D2 TaxID=1736538 RepID=UPI0007103AE0|nr:hypothetical protein [Paenibacillus sp. Root444D2]KQX68146.1 hypothetical protein ASD40_25010 [Paenibacillus sp. Root444D2]